MSTTLIDLAKGAGSSALDVAQPYLPLLRAGLKALPYLCAAGLLVALLLTRATLHEARSQYKSEVEQSALLASQKELSWENQLSAAQSGYQRSLKSLQDVKEKSDADDREFAQTSAGAVHCLDASRVQSILQARSDAEAALSAGGVDSPLPASAYTPQGPDSVGH